MRWENGTQSEDQFEEKLKEMGESSLNELRKVFNKKIYIYYD